LIAAVPPSLSAVAPAVEARVGDLLSAETDRWGLVDPELLPPLEALRRNVRPENKGPSKYFRLSAKLCGLNKGSEVSIGYRVRIHVECRQ